MRVIFDGEGKRGYTANLYDFKNKMEALLGRKVDVLSGSMIRNRYLELEIEQSQVMLYAA